MKRSELKEKLNRLACLQPAADEVNLLIKEILNEFKPKKIKIDLTQDFIDNVITSNGFILEKGISPLLYIVPEFELKVTAKHVILTNRYKGSSNILEAKDFTEESLDRFLKENT